MQSIPPPPPPTLSTTPVAQTRNTYEIHSLLYGEVSVFSHVQSMSWRGREQDNGHTYTLIYVPTNQSKHICMLTVSNLFWTSIDAQINAVACTTSKLQLQFFSYRRILGGSCGTFDLCSDCRIDDSKHTDSGISAAKGSINAHTTKFQSHTTWLYGVKEVETYSYLNARTPLQN